MSNFRDLIDEKSTQIVEDKDVLEESYKVTDAIEDTGFIKMYLDDIRMSGGVKQIRYDAKETQKYFDEVKKLKESLQKFVESKQ